MNYRFNYSRSLSLAITILVFLLYNSNSIYAITDAEAIKLAISMYQDGDSEAKIANALLEKGATLEQLERLQNQVQKQSFTETQATVTSLPTTTQQRINNTPQATFVPSEIDVTARQIFGFDFFKGERSKFDPSMNVATPKDYKLGSGDRLIINIFGASQENFTAQISPDGIITVSGYGPIHLGGLTIAEATKKLNATLGTRFQNSQLMLSLGQSRSIAVNVMGEIYYPGNYQMTAFANVLYAVYMAGGIRTTGTLRNIKVYRNSQLVSTVDLYDYILNGSNKQDIRLEDGDVVLVGTYSELVQIGGNIKRPMRYELLPNETLHNLIYFAGGFTGDAYTDAVRVTRRNTEDGYSVHTVSNTQFSNFHLMDGDSVLVEQILDRPQNTLEIQGAVFRPGFYGLSGNLHTVKQLVEMAQGVDEQAIPERSVLYRIKLDRTYEAIQLNVANILNGTTPDMELLNEDRIFIPSRKRQLDHFDVTIHGEVYEPGRYPYAENESVDNLIMRAGGLTDKASTVYVNVVRHLIDPSATKEAENNTISFSLSLEDSTAVREFILHPYDEVYIRATPAYASNQNVYVKGEVVFDGAYALQTKADRLSSIIAAAGGLTQYAYPEGARLIRKMDEMEKRSKNQILKMNAAASTRDSVNQAKLDLGDHYAVAINLSAALAHPGGPEDFVLRDSDVIIIPTITTTVRINGEVLYPNTVSFISGKKAKYYINQAGGYSQLARRSKSYVIYANGRVAKACSAKITPGCEIIVPSKPEKLPMTPTQWVGIASATASLASVSATLATLIINASKRQ